MQASLAITTLDIDGEGKTIVVRLSELLCCIKRRTFVDQQIVRTYALTKRLKCA